VKITAKTEYGVRAIMQVASSTNLTQVKEIAKKQNIPERFLEQVMSLLKKGGLVEAVRGAGGGYQLARHAKKITLRNIIEAIEGPINLMECLGEEEELKCGSASSACVVRDVFRGVQSTVAAAFNSITLADLVEKQNKSSAPTYHI